MSNRAMNFNTIIMGKYCDAKRLRKASEPIGVKNGNRKMFVKRMIASLFVLACLASSGTASEKKIETVALQLKYFHQFQFAGYYAAQTEGYYRDAGLSVEIREGDLQIDAVKEVTEGRAQYGISNSEVLLRRLRGDPVVALAAIFQHSPLVIMATEDSGIRHPQNMKGRLVGIDRSTRDAELLAMLHNEGVSLDDILPPKGGLCSVSMYYDGTADAGSAYITNEPYYLEQKNIPYRVIQPLTYGIDFYGDCLITSETEATRHTNRTRRFREASLRGWEYAMKNPERMADIILERYDSKKSRDHLLYEADKMRELIYPQLVEIGHMNPGRWRHIADTFVSLGMIDRDYDLDGFLYDADPRPEIEDVRRFFKILAIVVMAVAVGVACLLVFNRRLRREIRERKEARNEAVAANRAKSVFLANMSHELRTPLNAILGFAEILARNVSSDQRDDLRIIRQSGEHLLNLINDALDLAKVESGKIELEPEEFYLPGFLAGIVEIIRIRAGEEGLSFDFEADENSLPDSVRADERRLRQVLLNLLGNACKFTESGGVTLRVDRTGERLRFTVRDTGTGIPAEEQGRIFEPFFQLKNSQSRSQGTGLGLSISKVLVSLMGGELRVESEPGAGSAFWFELTLPETDGREISSWAAASKGEILRVKDASPTVLIVDDDSHNLSVFQKMLNSAGFSVLIASNGEEALDRVRIDGPDAVVTDLRMPGMDGFALIRKLGAEPAFRRLPIIAVSANLFDENRRRSLEIGADAFLSKPVARNRLLLELGRLLDLSWVYAPEPSIDRAVSAPEKTPARPVLENLLEMADTGDLGDLEMELDEIRAGDPRFEAFAHRVGGLARKFDLNQIRTLLRECME